MWGKVRNIVWGKLRIPLFSDFILGFNQLIIKFDDLAVDLLMAFPSLPKSTFSIKSLPWFLTDPTDGETGCHESYNKCFSFRIATEDSLYLRIELEQF